MYVHGVLTPSCRSPVCMHLLIDESDVICYSTVWNESTVHQKIRLVQVLFSIPVGKIAVHRTWRKNHGLC